LEIEQHFEEHVQNKQIKTQEKDWNAADSHHRGDRNIVKRVVIKMALSTSAGVLSVAGVCHTYFVTVLLDLLLLDKLESLTVPSFTSHSSSSIKEFLMSKDVLRLGFKMVYMGAVRTSTAELSRERAQVLRKKTTHPK
jgi:hypothetical protein